MAAAAAAGPRVCAPSLARQHPRDARDAADLATCRFEKSGHDALGDACGATPHEVSLDRLDEAVLPFDEPTKDKLRAQWNKGRARGLAPRVFGLVGDSITASPKFLTPVVQSGSLLAPDVATRLRVGDTSVIDVYRDVPVVGGLDSFRAPRAAKVGAPSGWATPPGITPAANVVGGLLATHRPAIVVLMFGSNDAATRFVSHAELVSGYRARMTRLLEQLDEAGVIVILNTVPRHMHDPARPSCDKNEGDLSNWRMAVQTSAVSAVAAELACARHLPLIDLRHAFDALLNHGIGPDGVHPNAHPAGAGRLDAEGLRCGYNARNYVTLRMLRQIHATLAER